MEEDIFESMRIALLSLGVMSEDSWTPHEDAEFMISRLWEQGYKLAPTAPAKNITIH